MSEKLTIVTIPGDGIGPEVMAVVLGVLEAAGVCLDYRQCVAGEAAFKAGISTGVPQETMDAIREHRIVLKGPLATPVGYGERSANVQLRRLCRTYGNIRPAKSIPGIPSRYSDTPIDLVIVRENLEGLYAGIEYMQTPDVAETLKLVSRQGCSNITRLTQFYAKTHGRKHVHCVTKANIMKLSEGILKSTFESIMEEDKDLGSSHMIVDNCAHQLVMNPEQFDVIVTGNMNGDILSDLASGLVGGLGIAASMNIGENAAIFEAVHGSAPDIVGKNMANPTALLQSAILMLRFLSLSDAADRIESALFETLGAGIATKDIHGANGVTTEVFQAEIIKRLRPSDSNETAAFPAWTQEICQEVPAKENTNLEGIDVFINSQYPLDELKTRLQSLSQGSGAQLERISYQGLDTEVLDPSTVRYPAFCICHFDCTDSKSAATLLSQIADLDWVHVEKRYACS